MQCKRVEVGSAKAESVGQRSLPPPSNKSISVGLIRVHVSVVSAWWAWKEAPKHDSCMRVIVTTWMFKQPDKDKRSDQISKKRKGRWGKCKKQTSFRHRSPSRLIFFLNFRHGDDPPCSCGKKWGGSRLLNQTMKNQCHSCPTLHLVWWRGCRCLEVSHSSNRNALWCLTDWQHVIVIKSNQSFLCKSLKTSI